MHGIKEYSLFVVPSDNVYKRLAKVISALSMQFSTPNFEPHLTLLGGLTYDEKELLAKTSELAAATRPFEVKLNKVGFTNNYLKCLFIRAEKTGPLIEANSKARKIFNGKKDSKYVPHLSLMYGILDTKTKEKIIEKIGSSFPISLKVKNIYLFNLNGQPKDWYMVEKFALKDN